MASTNLLAQFFPKDAIPESGGNPTGGEFGLIRVGLQVGLGYNKLTTAGAMWLVRMPATAGFSTGATFTFIVADDPNNPSPGLVGNFGVNVAPVAAGAPFDTTNLGTEATGTVTMNATSGLSTILTISMLVANMNSLAAGSYALVRLRRLGATSTDTHRGRIVVLAGDMRDT